jgi:hypothetical protein
VRLAVLIAVAVALSLPSLAHANGDPASDYLLGQDVFFPFGPNIDPGAAKRLQDTIDAGKKEGFRIRVALILSPSDLGTAFSLFKKPQRYSEFLGSELTFAYRDRLLVVMPNGFGYSVNGKPMPATARALKSVTPPGADATKETEAAVTAIHALAGAEGKRIVLPKGSGNRDRLIIAAAALAGLSVVAGVVLFRRSRRTLPV